MVKNDTSWVKLTAHGGLPPSSKKRFKSKKSCSVATFAFDPVRPGVVMVTRIVFQRLSNIALSQAAFSADSLNKALRTSGNRLRLHDALFSSVPSP